METHWGILLLSFAAFWGRHGVLCMCSYCSRFLSRKACLHNFCTLFFWPCGDPSVLQLWLFLLSSAIVTPALWCGLPQSVHVLSWTEVLNANGKILSISPLGIGVLCAFKKNVPFYRLVVDVKGPTKTAFRRHSGSLCLWGTWSWFSELALR